MRATIYEVTEEQIVKALYITILSILAWGSPKIEETHQITVLSVNISEDLQRCSHYKGINQ